MRPFDIFLGVLVAVTWGLGLTLAKAALGEFPPILLTACRFSVTALALVWFVKPPVGQMRRILLISFVISTVQYSLTFTGLAGVDASTAAIVLQLEVPFATLLAAIFLNDRIGFWRIGGMVMAFGGVALIAGQPQMRDELLPLFLVLAGALVWSVGNILVKTLDGSVAGFRLIAWLAAFSAPQLFIASLLLEDGQAAAIAGASWLSWGVILYLGLVMTAFGYGLWFHLLNHHPVSHVMPFLLLLPVTSMVSAVLLLDEVLTAVTIIGAALVLIGVGTIMYRQARKAEVAAAVAPQAVPPD